MRTIGMALAGSLGAVAMFTPALGDQPAVEANFVAAVISARDTYTAAGNDMVKGGARATRKDAICRALGSLQAKDWTGTLYKLTTNGDGNGVVEITIGPDVYVKTWNNSLSDIGDHTLIPAGSPLFNTFAQMKEGQSVRFSGTFFRTDVDCIREPSMTLDGSMREPEFIIRFTAASPL